MALVRMTGIQIRAPVRISGAILIVIVCVVYWYGDYRERIGW